MVKILKTNTGGVWEKEKPRSLLVGLQTGAVTLEISVGNSQKAKKINLPYGPAIPLLGILPVDVIVYCKHSCSAMFTGTLFIIASIWEQPKHLSTDKWIIKM